MTTAEYGRIQPSTCPLERWLEYKSKSSASRGSCRPGGGGRGSARCRTACQATCTPPTCRFREINRDSPRLPERRVPLLRAEDGHPRRGSTVSCSVFRAPREYEGSLRQRPQLNTAEYGGVRVLSSAGWGTRMRIRLLGTRYGEIWGDMGRYEEIWGDMGRYGEIWGDMGRYGLRTRRRRACQAGCSRRGRT